MKITNREKILLHLYDYKHIQPAIKISKNITQKGIIEKLGLAKQTVSKRLNELIEEGYVKRGELGHVEDIPKRVYPYHITEEGVKYAIKIKGEDSLDSIDREEAEILRRWGRIHWKKGRNDEALEAYEKSLTICRRKGFLEEEGKILIDKGNFYGELKQLDKAIEFHNKAISILETIGNKDEELCRVYSNLGIVHRLLEDYEKGLEYQQLVINKGSTTKANGHGYIEAAYCLAMMGRIKKAMEYNEKGLKIFEALKDKDMIAGYWKVLGVIHREKGEYDESLKCIKKGLEINESKSKVHNYIEEIEKTKALIEKKRKKKR